jgi:hypothetical protein
MPEIWGKLTFRPNLSYFATREKIGFENRTVWEILLGQRGSKNHFGTGASQGCRIISVNIHFRKMAGMGMASSYPRFG